MILSVVTRSEMQDPIMNSINIMNKGIIVSVFFIMVVFISEGQVSLGAKVGLNSNKLVSSREEFKSVDTRYGFVLGGFVRFKVEELSLQPEIIYSQKGGKYTYSTLAGVKDTIFKNSINYFDIPLIFGFHPHESIYLQTGPVFSLMVNEKIEFEVEGNSIISNFSEAVDDEMNLEWQIGAGVEMNRFTFTIRYEFAIHTTLDDIHIPNSDVVVTPDARNNLWQFTIGYQLFSYNGE